MKKETYQEARLRLFRELSEQGLQVKPALKIPQAKLPSGDILFFKPQAVYLNQHSLWIDIRGMNVQTFLAIVRDTKAIRTKDVH